MSAYVVPIDGLPPDLRDSIDAVVVERVVELMTTLDIVCKVVDIAKHGRCFCIHPPPR